MVTIIGLALHPRQTSALNPRAYGQLNHLSYTQISHYRSYLLKNVMNQERRRFHRIDFDARVEIAQGDSHWQAQLLDISLKGVLLTKLGHYQLSSTETLLVKIILSDQTSIDMITQAVHQTVDQVHLACMSIDIDSISHLRRLIELNLGDADAAERELCELLAEPTR